MSELAMGISLAVFTLVSVAVLAGIDHYKGRHGDE